MQLTNAEREVSLHLGFGHYSAKPAKLLAEQIGLHEREIRHAIESIRRKGIIILNLQDGWGYFYPKFEDSDNATMFGELLSQYRATKSRIRSLEIQNSYLRNMLLKNEIISEDE
jgi:biotin operon repressor